MCGCVLGTAGREGEANRSDKEGAGEAEDDQRTGGETYGISMVSASLSSTIRHLIRGVLDSGAAENSPIASVRVL